MSHATHGKLDLLRRAVPVHGMQTINNWWPMAKVSHLFIEWRHKDVEPGLATLGSSSSIMHSYLLQRLQWNAARRVHWFSNVSPVESF